MSDTFGDRIRPSRRTAIVATGDLVAIALFVAAGERSHGSPVLAGVDTFLAFAVAWIVVALLVGAYDERGLSTSRRIVGSAAIAWIPAALLGQIVRAAVVPGATIAPTFVVVSLVVGALLLVAWRVIVSLTVG